MSIYIGDKEIKNLYVGDSSAKEAYLGENKVRPTITAGIYRNQTEGLISLSSDGSNWITIADKNLGATQVYNNGDTLSEANCGKYYQWGNNYGFPFTGPTTTSTTQVNARSYGPNNYYSSSTFIKGANYQSSWDSSTNKNLRGGVTGTVTAMKGPCPSGFHVMSVDESDTLLLKRASIRGVTAEVIINGHRITNSTDISNFLSDLKIPLGGSISWLGSKSTASGLWTSTYTASYSIYVVGLDTSQITAKYNGNASPNGEAIRPFKNEAVQPDNSWDVIYQKESGNLMSYSDFITYWDNNGYTAAQNKLNEYPTEYYNKYNSEGHIVIVGGQQRLDHYDSGGVFMYWNGTNWYAS